MSQSDHDFVARARAAIEAWSGTGATTENDVTAATLWAEGFRLDGPSAPPEPLTRWFSLLPRTARNTGAVQSRQGESIESAWDLQIATTLRAKDRVEAEQLSLVTHLQREERVRLALLAIRNQYVVEIPAWTRTMNADETTIYTTFSLLVRYIAR